MRNAEINRETKETNVHVWIDLEGSGKSDVNTGVGFLDHMLELFAAHSGFDLVASCAGDNDVDDHHSVEDIGIALGKAFTNALGDRRGISRYGDTILPMDESLILTSVDISGRSYLGYDVDIPTEKVGTFDTELVQEFLMAFVRNAGITLHVIMLRGGNSHHIIEGIFKSLARTLKEAVSIDDERKGEVPSTKGMIDDAGDIDSIIDEGIPEEDESEADTEPADEENGAPEESLVGEPEDDLVDDDDGPEIEVVEISPVDIELPEPEIDDESDELEYTPIEEQDDVDPDDDAFDGMPYEEPEVAESEIDTELELDEDNKVEDEDYDEFGNTLFEQMSKYGDDDYIFGDDDGDTDEDDIEKLAESMARTALGEGSYDEPMGLDADVESRDTTGLADDEYGKGVAHGYTDMDISIQELEKELNEKGLLK